jgi:putative hemolysin
LAILCAFVFAGSETAITGMGELRIKKLLEHNKGPKKWLELWLRDPSRVLTTLLAGNTLASVLASALTTSLALHTAHRHGLDASWLEAVAIGLLTVVLLVAGEIAPKTLAKNHPEWFLPLMHVVWWFHLSTRWLTHFLIWTAMHIVRALGGKHPQGGFQVTEEQLEDMVRIGSEEGSIDEDRGDILQNVFDLGGLNVRAIMTPRTQIDGLGTDATFEEVAAAVQANHFSRYPVYERTLDKIVGIFHAKDLMDYALSGRQGEFKLADHVRDTRFVPETKKAIELLKELQTAKVHMVIVVDEHGGTAGIVTMEDVLEELVGEIYDEYDQPEPVVEPAGPNGWHIEASAEIRDLAATYEIELPETSSYSTVGGFLVEQLGHVPKPGEELRWQDLTFKVLEADETRVVKVEIQRDVDAHLNDDGPMPKPSTGRHSAARQSQGSRASTPQQNLRAAG